MESSHSSASPSSLRLFVFKSDTENSASDVDIQEDIFYITDDEDEAYAHFARPWYIEFWEEMEKEEGKEGCYDKLSEEEKKQLHKTLCTGPYYGHEVYQFPIAAIQGMDRVVAPFQKRIRVLENQQRTDAFVRSTRDPGTEEDRLPKEIVDTIITRMLNEDNTNI